jgi:hypothetical protein
VQIRNACASNRQSPARFHLTEINVPSPTGIREIKPFGGPNIAALLGSAA